MIENEEKRRRLEALLENDEIFMVYRNTNELYSEKFEKFSAAMPEQARNVLFGYGDSARQMYLRALALVCEHMDFKDKA